MVLSTGTKVERGMIQLGSKEEEQKELVKGQYFSGWHILPDLVASILNGCAARQKFKMHKYGIYQGEIRVILLKDGEFKPRIGTSGSSEVLYMAEPVRDFLFSSRLAPFYHLDDRNAADLIHLIFLNVMEGVREKEFCLSNDVRVKYQYENKEIRFCSVSELLNEEQISTVNLVDDFFRSVNVDRLFGIFLSNLSL